MIDSNLVWLMWLQSIDADLCSTELGILSDLVQKAFMNFAVAVMAATTAVKGGVKLHTSIIRNSAIMKTSILDGRSSASTQVFPCFFSSVYAESVAMPCYLTGTRFKPGKATDEHLINMIKGTKVSKDQRIRETLWKVSFSNKLSQKTWGKDGKGTFP